MVVWNNKILKQKNMIKNYASMVATAILGGAITLGGYKLFIDKHNAKQEAS